LVTQLGCIADAGETRFATKYIMAERILAMREDLEAAVDSDVWRDKLPRNRGARRAAAASRGGGGVSRGGRNRQLTAHVTEQAQEAQQQADAAAQRAEEDPVHRVRQMIKSDEFWADVEKVEGVCRPIVLFLRLMDSGQPVLSKVYRWFYVLQQWVAAMGGDVDAVTEVEGMMRAMGHAVQHLQQQRLEPATLEGSPAAGTRARTRARTSAAEEEEDELFIPALEQSDAEDVMRAVRER
jgi:hypothetical protein